MNEDTAAVMLRRFGYVFEQSDDSAYPAIADVTSDFAYLRLQKGDDDIPTAYGTDALKHWADIAMSLAEGDVPAGLPLAAPGRRVEKRPRDVFVYFIHEGKVRAPHAAMAFMDLVS